MNLPILFFLAVIALAACSGPDSSGETIPASSEKLNPPLLSPSKPLPSAAGYGTLEKSMRDAGLVDISVAAPGILVDLKYSSTDNFLRMDVYGDLQTAFLRREAAEKLAKAQKKLADLKPDFHLLVYDAARPRRVQYIMWEKVNLPDKINYVANPETGSIHNFGMAVDLTVANNDGKPLDMGTEFDYFGPLAQPQLEPAFLADGKLSKEQISNRELLRSVMRSGGFYGIETEWWHFVADWDSVVRSNCDIIE